MMRLPSAAREASTMEGEEYASEATYVEWAE
jgi:hypothetical protein